MWTKGKIAGYEFSVKHFSEGSEYGINEGRISKLEIKKDEKILVNYDREWDIEPEGQAVLEVYEQILKKFN